MPSGRLPPHACSWPAMAPTLSVPAKPQGGCHPRGDRAGDRLALPDRAALLGCEPGLPPRRQPRHYLVFRAGGGEHHPGGRLCSPSRLLPLLRHPARALPPRPAGVEHQLARSSCPLPPVLPSPAARELITGLRAMPIPGAWPPSAAAGR